MSKAPQAKVPPRSEGTAQPVEATVQQGLAERTLAKLISFGEAPTPVQLEEGSGFDKDAALALLREAFREANCHATLQNVHFWDLAGNSRLVADLDGQQVVLPANGPPQVGQILQWNGQTYYVGSLKEPSNAS